MARPRNPNNYYFNDDTEAAVLKYAASDDENERNVIFNEYLNYPFNKLAENLIHKYKFYNFNIPYEDLKHTVVIFLLSLIEKVDPTRGRAYSYLSYCGRNFLINGNWKAYKEKINCDDIEGIDESSNSNCSYELEIETFSYKKLFQYFTEYMYDNLDKMFSDQKDKMIADAVLDLFVNVEHLEEVLEKLDKKVLYILIRERTGLETKHITPVVKVIKSEFYQKMKEYEKQGKLY